LSPPQEKVYSRLSEAEKASLRAKELSGQFITFARGGAPIKRIIDLAELIRATADFALNGSSVSCEFSVPPDLWPVEADEVQLRQAIGNLIMNADEAMPEGGSVRIMLENVTLGPGAVPPLVGGRYCRVSISDQGAGISPEHLSRIFEPYFTTKGDARGLGLFTAYSIIQRHDGRITVESVEGEGTTFSIYLPTAVGEICTPAEGGSKTPYPGDRILVMDDEAVIREVAGEILNHLGFEVDFAKNGEEAVELFARARESGRPFAAVILDLTIPGGMGGKEAVAGMLKIDPSVKAIVASGYANDTIFSDYMSYGFSGCITKPYTFNELTMVMRDTLGLKNNSLRISKVKE
jgi:CheY-like chemotaxis protein